MTTVNICVINYDNIQWVPKMKTTTLQQLKEKAFENPEVKEAYDNETLDVKDVEVIKIKSESNEH